MATTYLYVGLLLPTSAYKGFPTTFSSRRGIQFHVSCVKNVLMELESKRKSTMKKLFLFALSLLFSMSAQAQKDVTRFLGIPVDGSKSEMIRKLKEKGFSNNPYDSDILTGEFNGINVNIHVVTNNNKVCRIMVCDENPVDERSIQIRFNHLCKQFENNPKYLSPDNSYTIPDDEDIDYEITVHKKRYDALFYQAPIIDSVAIANEMSSLLLSKYTEEQLANLTEEQTKEISFNYVKEKIFKKPVWFMISSHLGRYYITMFYDNEYNRAQGEDL